MAKQKVSKVRLALEKTAKEMLAIGEKSENVGDFLSALKTRAEIREMVAKYEATAAESFADKSRRVKGNTKSPTWENNLFAFRETVNASRIPEFETAPAAETETAPA